MSQLLLSLALWGAPLNQQGVAIDLEDMGTSLCALSGEGVSFVAGCPEASGAGRVVLVRDSKLVWESPGREPGDRFGHQIALLGDSSGKEGATIACGAPGSGAETAPGYVRVFSLAGALLRDVSGTKAGDRFGYSLSSLGDLDNDGHPDLAVGGPQCTRSGLSPRNTISAFAGDGYVSILSGKTLEPLRVLASPRSNAAFGTALTRMSDLTGDGIDELAVGAPTATLNGRAWGAVYVVDVTTGKILQETSADREGRLGISLALVCDLDGDGREDLAAGSGALSHITKDGHAKIASGYVALLSSGSPKILGVLPRDPGRYIATDFGASLCSIRGPVEKGGPPSSLLLVGSPTERNSTLNNDSGAVTLWKLPERKLVATYEITASEAFDEHDQYWTPYRFGASMSVVPGTESATGPAFFIAAPDIFRRGGAILEYRCTATEATRVVWAKNLRH